MKVGLNVVRVRKRLAQRDDWPRIGEVLLDTSNDASLAHSHRSVSHLRWRATPTDYTVDLAERARRIAGILNRATADILSK
jgi:hypothetical protein